MLVFSNYASTIYKSLGERVKERELPIAIRRSKTSTQAMLVSCFILYTKRADKLTLQCGQQ